MSKNTGHVMDAVAMAGGLLAGLERSGAGRSDNPLEQASGLEAAFRAFHLLALSKLYRVKEQFPATNQGLMVVPEPQIHPERDALVHAADFLAPIDVIDLLSETGLPCVAPYLHRGWQDRQRSCLHARQLAASAFGFWIGGEERGALMTGIAIVNRVALVPPPVQLDPAATREAYKPVLHLVERLAAGSDNPVFKNLPQRVLGS